MKKTKKPVAKPLPIPPFGDLQSPFDINGSWTGVPVDFEVPPQDVDDL